MINVEVQTDRSLQDLQDAMRDGTSVMRSAHVGNQRPYNLAVASLGIPMLLVDHNIVSQFPEDRPGDRNYLPGSIVTREQIMPMKIEQLGGLSLRTEVVSPFSGETTFVDRLHSEQLQTAFPDTPVRTSSEYLRSEEQLVQDIVRLALDLQPELFTRFVESDGTITTINGSPDQLFQKYGILQLADDPRSEAGILMPNEVDIVCNFVIEALRSGKATQIHLSGPDMKHYLFASNERGFVPINKIQELYQALVASRSTLNLPEDLTVELVPVDEARFATSGDRYPVLARIFDVLRYELVNKDRKAAFFQSSDARDPEKRQVFLDENREVERSISSSLQAGLDQGGEFFVGPRQAPYVSQYDVLAKDDRERPVGFRGAVDKPFGFVMTGENRVFTMAELRILTKRLRQLRDNTS